jgi:uncharacterized membrane protein
MSNSTKYILAAVQLTIFYVWNRYGNLKELMGGRYTIDFICFITISILIAAPIWGSIVMKKIKVWMFAIAIILAFVPIGYFTHLLMLSKQFLIVYCVMVIASIVIFRKELLQIKY